MRIMITALVTALFVPLARAATQEVKAFDSVAYRDSGGFAGGGTGKSLTVTADGNLNAQRRDGPRTTLRLQSRELAELSAAVVAVDWQHIQRIYRLPGGHDIVSRDLTITIGGNTYETHADMLTKVPDGLGQLFDCLDAIYDRAVGPPKR